MANPEERKIKEELRIVESDIEDLNKEIKLFTSKIENKRKELSSITQREKWSIAGYLKRIHRLNTEEAYSGVSKSLEIQNVKDDIKEYKALMLREKQRLKSQIEKLVNRKKQVFRNLERHKLNRKEHKGLLSFYKGAKRTSQ